MSRWVRVGIGVLAFVVMSSPLPAQQSDPRVGTWKLNVAKSKYNPGPPPTSQVVTIQAADGGFKMMTDTVTAQGGNPNHSEIVAKFDGKPHPIKGNPSGEILRTYRRVDGRTVESQDTFKGVASYKRREVVSSEGKTLTVTVTGPNLQGVVTNNMLVYDKQ